MDSWFEVKTIINGFYFYNGFKFGCQFFISTLKQQKDFAEIVVHNKMPKIVTLLRLRINAESAVRFLWAATGFENLEVRKNKLENANARFEKFESEYNAFVKLSPSQAVAEAMQEMFKNWKTVESFSHDVSTKLVLMNKGQDGSVQAFLLFDKKQLEFLFENLFHVFVSTHRSHPVFHGKIRKAITSSSV